jgi:hypothetical protein
MIELAGLRKEIYEFWSFSTEDRYECVRGSKEVFRVGFHSYIHNEALPEAAGQKFAL